MWLRKVRPLAIAYVLVVAFLIGLLVDRRPPSEPAAVPVLGPAGARRPAAAPYPAQEAEVRPAGLAPLWLELFRPAPETAWSILAQTIPYWRGLPVPHWQVLHVYGEEARPRRLVEVVFPFLARGAGGAGGAGAMGPGVGGGPAGGAGTLGGSAPGAPGAGAPGGPGPAGVGTGTAGGPAGPAGAATGGSGAARGQPGGGGGPAAGGGGGMGQAADLGDGAGAVGPGGTGAGATGASGSQGEDGAAGGPGSRGRCLRPPGVVPVAGGVPLVGIYHTHEYESYISEFPGLNPRSDADWLKVASADPQHNIIRVGRHLADALCRRGITVVHSPSPNAAAGGYDNAYEVSYRTARYILEQYPTVRVLLDIHRDGQDPARADVTAQVGGKPVARVMLVVGAGTSEQPQPRFQQNLTWAQRVDQALDQRYKGVSRGVAVRPYWYNQHLAPGALLLEVGSVRNHMDEALRTAEILADVLADLIRNGQYPR